MQSLNLNPLQNFVQRVLILSEETKNVLQSDCDEARFALKSWPHETSTHKELDKSICTCNATELDDQLQINDIDRSILQRQELKEKLKTNLLRERSRTRKPDIREIYMPKSKSLTRLKQTSSKSQSRLENKQDSKCKIMSENICDENNSREIKRRSSSTIRQIEIGSKSSSSVVNKKLPQLSQNDSRTKLKTGSQTNYVLANKQNFNKNMKPSENKSRLPPLVKVESTLSNEFMKMQIQTPLEIVKKTLQNENCPFHGNNTNIRIVKSVNAVEGLDRNGVPSSLVKVLKVYHSYLKAKFSGTETRDRKSEEASNKFLMEFNKMCDQRIKQVSKSEKLSTLVKGYIEILDGLYDKDTNRIQKKEFKTKYSNLDSEYKNIFDGEKDARSKISEASTYIHLNKRGWMSNGIWNDLCIINFEGMFKTLCIRYSSRAQLVLLFDVTQQLQRAKYQEVLVHYLLHKVIPDSKKFLDSNSKEFSEVYKMCFTIIQVMNPKATVLVRTE